MKQLKQLAAAVGAVWTAADREVTFLTDNSAKVTPGCVFICIAGRHFDGHTKAAEALAQGAAAVVVSRDLGLEKQILVENTRQAYALMAAAFFDHPERRLRLIGVTGTNGKTTSCFILRSILMQMGHCTGLIGTVMNIVGERELPAALTTPDCFELFSLFSQMVQAQCEYCVMEVSSQALDQHRVDGIRFDAAIFTNLTRDHLDYHGSFENYKAAKRKLFAACDLAVVNADDPAAAEMTAGMPCRAVTFSIEKNTSDYSAKNIQIAASGIKYELVSNDNIGRASFPVPGRFSVYNSMGAAVCLIEMGFNFSAVLSGLAGCAGVPGRMEVVPTGTPYTVLIDYAHTPDGLENVLKCVREIAAGRVITVFGCGGDRDATKRPLMGDIASRLSDVAVVTSDNPRTEDPLAIIEDIKRGLNAGMARILVEPDRRTAIRRAMMAAKVGDIVVLAGKGQETYQILNTGKIHFDEREVVAEILAAKTGEHA